MSDHTAVIVDLKSSQKAWKGKLNLPRVDPSLLQVSEARTNIFREVNELVDQA